MLIVLIVPYNPTIKPIPLYPPQSATLCVLSPSHLLSFGTALSHLTYAGTMLRISLFAIFIAIVSQIIVVDASGASVVSVRAISGVVDLHPSVPPSTIIDIGLYNKDGRIVRSTRATGRLGFFELYGVSGAEDGCTVRASVASGRLDESSSRLSVAVPTGENTSDPILIRGLILAFANEESSLATSGPITVPSIPSSVKSTSIADSPLSFQLASTGSFAGMLVMLVVVIVAVSIGDRAFSTALFATKLNRRPQQATLVGRVR